MAELRAKYYTLDVNGKIMDNHTTYSNEIFTTLTEAEAWLNSDEGDMFVDACMIDSKQESDYDKVDMDDVTIVEILKWTAGSPPIEKEV